MSSKEAKQHANNTGCGQKIIVTIPAVIPLIAMIAAPPTVDEEIRIRELDQLNILDTLEEDEYDAITRIASKICETPISLISLVDRDRQWFKSHHGLAARETPREYAFCAHAIHTPDDIFEVSDSRLDERFHDNPLVTGDPRVIFYAGVPLVTDGGQPVGTLCVIDHETRELDQEQQKALRGLAGCVVKLLSLRVKTIELDQIHGEVHQKNKELEEFTRNAAHDLKSPLSSIIGLTTALLNNCKDSLDEEDYELVEMIDSSSKKLHRMIEGLLHFYKNQTLTLSVKEPIPVKPFFNELFRLFAHLRTLEFECTSEIETLTVNESALNQIFLNLISNAVKYCDKDQILIRIEVRRMDDEYVIAVVDNGPGIPPEHASTLFKAFETGGQPDRFGNKGTGIGLHSVMELLKRMGGSLSHQNNESGVGSTFIARWLE